MIRFVINPSVISYRDLIGSGLNRIGSFRHPEMEDHLNLEDKRRVLLLFKNFLQIYRDKFFLLGWIGGRDLSLEIDYPSDNAHQKI